MCLESSIPHLSHTFKVTLPAGPLMLVLRFTPPSPLRERRLDSSWVKQNWMVLSGIHNCIHLGNWSRTPSSQTCMVQVLGHWHRLFPFTAKGLRVDARYLVNGLEGHREATRAPAGTGWHRQGTGIPSGAVARGRSSICSPWHQVPNTVFPVP